MEDENLGQGSCCGWDRLREHEIGQWIFVHGLRIVRWGGLGAAMGIVQGFLIIPRGVSLVGDWALTTDYSFSSAGLLCFNVKPMLPHSRQG